MKSWPIGEPENGSTRFSADFCLTKAQIDGLLSAGAFSPDDSVASLEAVSNQPPAGFSAGFSAAGASVEGVAKAVEDAGGGSGFELQLPIGLKEEKG